MKKLLSILVAFSFVLAIPFSCKFLSARANNSQDTPPPAESDKGYKALNHDYVKAVWLSQFDMSPVYTDRGAQRNMGEYIVTVGQMITNIKDCGLNTVFIQLRPNADSIYPSKIYPPSKYACGSYSGKFLYDPFEIFLNMAHKAGLSVHAWINPLRCMTESEIKEIPRGYTLSEWYHKNEEGYIVNVDGRYYLDPAHKETRALICRGVEEIMKSYDVDGIHIDDYFYPTTAESFDKSAYLEYKESGGALSLDNFRRENINKLVSEIYDTVKKENPTVLFGVSPSGNTDRNYNTLYADTAIWCSTPGYIDYICPQVYFGFEHSTCAFERVCGEFSSMVKNKDVKLIIGMTLGKAASAYDGEIDVYAGAGAEEWINEKDILLRSYEHTKTLDNCVGVSYFSYQYFYDVSSGEPNPKTAEERKNLLPALKNG